MFSTALAKMVEGGFVFKGLKPVNWCFDCSSALAEAEVEYQDKKSDAIDVAFQVEDADKLAEAFGEEAWLEQISKKGNLRFRSYIPSRLRIQRTGSRWKK